MNETNRLKKLLKDHYDGTPWLDVNIADTLVNISSANASKKVGDHNSIYQIVNHMILWRESLLNKLKGEAVYVPGNNFIEGDGTVTKKEWENTLKKFKNSQKEIIKFLSKSRDEEFDKLFPNGHNYYEHLQAILQHDAYHLGQIVILIKLIKI